MPDTVTLYLVGAWLVVGFSTGMGWALGTAIVARVLR